MRKISAQIVFCTILCFFILLSDAYSQPEPVKWGRVSQSEMDISESPFGDEAPAIILVDYGKVVVDQGSTALGATLFRHKRLKILNENGYDHADVSIEFYSKDKAERIREIKAQAIHPDGSKSSISKKDIFTEELNEYWSVVKFALPDIQPGCIIEYSYIHVSERIMTLFPWDFQNDLPTLHSELVTQIPGFLEYNFLTQGENTLYDLKRWETGPQRYGDITVPINHAQFIKKDAPALKDEPHVTTKENFRTRIRFQLLAYLERNGYRKEILGNPVAVAQSLRENDRFGRIIQRENRAKKLISEAMEYINDEMSDEEKAILLYTFIQRHIKWDGYRSYLAEDTPDKIFAEGKGRSASINLCLIRLLRSAGIEAYPLLISTRSHGKPYPYTTIMDQFNHTLVYCNINGNIMYFDPINEFLPPGIPDMESLNYYGWLITDDDNIWINIRPSDSGDIIQLQGEINENGHFKGVLKTRSTTYSAIPERSKYLDSEDPAIPWRSRLNKQYPATSLSDPEITPIHNVLVPFEESFNIEIENFAVIEDNIIFLSPIFYSQFDENPFKSENRYYPVEFTYPFFERVIMNIKFPTHWNVESLPDPLKVTLEGKVNYEYRANVRDDNLQITHKLELKHIKYEPEEYALIKEVFDHVAKTARSQIVFLPGVASAAGQK